LNRPSTSNTRPTLSVCIITLNEEENISRCLMSVSDMADEVVVVDSLSRDRTCEIAAAAGARVFRQPFLGYVGQKQLALEKATGDWILSLDADEWLDERLRESIKGLLAGEYREGMDGYRVKRRVFYLGKWLRYYDSSEWKLRLVRRGKASWIGCGPHNLHERLEVAGPPVGRLKGRLNHLPYKSISDHLLRLDAYTDILALNPAGQIRAFLGMTLEPPLTFLKKFLFQAGFLDGIRGFIFATMDAVYVFLRFAKSWKASRERKGEKDDVYSQNR